MNPSIRLPKDISLELIDLLIAIEDKKKREMEERMREGIQLPIPEYDPIPKEEEHNYRVIIDLF